ncbi:MAG: COX15/CtaA family protein [Planctomycetota bacterium]
MSAPFAPPSPASAARRRFSVFLVLATLFLIFAGAEVKSRQAGLAVPDWPLSFGMWWPPMVGNIYYEHGHRTIAAAVGLLTTILLVWTLRAESRPAVRSAAWAAFVLVCVQGLFGGLTVKNLLWPPLSITHALLAQTFLCVLGWLAYRVSREGAVAAAASHSAARRLTGLAVAAIFVQLLLGAVMRHNEAGLAVPFFPLSESGSLLPASFDARVVLHLLHRGFALVVTVFVVAALIAAVRARPHLRLHAGVAGLVLAGQILLGAAVIWTARTSEADGVSLRVSPVHASLHVMTGALLLLLAFLLALRVRQPEIAR